MNLVEAECSGGKLSFARFTIPAPGDRELSSYEGKTVILGVRPSDFEDASLRRDESLPVIEVVPDVVEVLGTETHVIFTVDAPPVLTEETVAAASLDGDEDVVQFSGGGATFTASVDPRSRARPQEAIRLTVDPARLYFFDPSTGDAIRERGHAHAHA
jgi:multiple sugar transport system ATP-binding protein